MNFFGSGPTAQAPAMAPGAKKPGTTSYSVGGTGGETYPKEGTFVTSCSFFLFLWVIPVCIILLYHLAPATILTLVGVWVMITLTPWAFHAGSAVGADISGPLLTMTMLMSVVCSFLAGVSCYYEHAQPMRLLATAREYTGVFPELPGLGFPDAAFVEFAGNATVDTSKVTSYQSLDSGLTTICVAPIKSAASTDRHDFWAIGVDCCGENGDKFECYDAGVAGVKTGWVLPSKFDDALFSTLGRYVTRAAYRHDLFLKAVQKAEALHGITSSGDKTILMRWTARKKEDIIYWENFSMGAHILTQGVILAIASFFMTRLYQRFEYFRSEQVRRHARGEMDAGEDRMHKFMTNAWEGGDDGDMAGTIDRVKGLRSGKGLEQFRPPLSASDMCLMGVLMPYLMLMGCVVLSTYSPCWEFGPMVLAAFWSLTSIAIIALLATPNRAVSGFFLLLCCTAGYYIGNVNYKENMFQYCSSEDRRLYKDVKPEANTADYWDAGRLNFDSTSMLSTNHSVGFLYQGTTYCAAPVISKTAPCLDISSDSGSPGNVAAVDAADDGEDVATSLLQLDNLQTLAPHADAPLTFMQRRSSRHHSRRARRHSRSVETSQYGGCKKIAPVQVEFWAIGVDCCDARKKFWCDGGELKDSRQAVVVRAFGDEDSKGMKLKSDRGHFFQAIDQATSAYELPLPNRPVLLRWGMDSETLQADWNKRAVGLILMTGLASLLLILAIGMTSFCFMKRQRRLEKQSLEAFDQRSGGAGAATTDQTVYDSPRNSLGPADFRSMQQAEDQMRF